MFRKRVLLTFLIAVVAVSSPAWAATYKIDPDHTTVEFAIRHLFTKVRGTFNTFEGTFDYEPDKPQTWKTNVVIQVASIDTRVEQRDNHLRSKDFFEVETYPTLTFKSTEATDITQDGAKLHGLLTIHGVEKLVVLDVTVHGVTKDPWGNVRSGATASTRFNRKDFGLTWNKTLETGQVLVGEEVDITIEAEGILQP